MLGTDYDSNRHRYSSRYLNPQGYELTIDAFPRKIVEPRGDQQISPHGDRPARPRDKVRLLIPEDTVAVEFSIIQVGKPFKKQTYRSVSINSAERSPWIWKVVVPEEGTFDITVKLKNQENGGPKTTRRIVVRDYLVV